MKTFRFTFVLTLLCAALGLGRGLAQTTPEPPAPPPPPVGELREVGAESAAPVTPDAEPDDPDADVPDDHTPRSSPRTVFGRDVLVSAGERVREAVAIFGSTIVDGIADGEVVAVFGDATLNGEAHGEVVAILGNVTINGHVHNQVVAVMGGVQLGPKAVVDGEVVSVGGGVERAPGAVVSRGVQEIAFLHGTMPRFDGLRAWFRECLMWGRPLAFGDNLGWAWGVAGAFFGFYLLLALIFGRGVTACAETLEQRPGYTILASFLTMILMPILTVLLAVTGVGPFVMFLIGVAGSLFGKAAFITWLGRRITKPLNIALPVAAAAIGGVLLILCYIVPFFGFVMWKLSSVLGFGMVVYTVILAIKRNRPAPAVAASTAGGVPPATGATAPSNPFVTTDGAVSPVPERPPGFVPAVPPVPAAPRPLSDATALSLPRAGFWIRAAASAIDVILVSVAVGFLNAGNAFIGILATYCVVFWALRGTTVGGIICGLKVVRLDGRKVDWMIAIVRALGGFLSLVVAGLGFIWVAFDDERQSWHDKIAGTTIVRVPKGTALV